MIPLSRKVKSIETESRMVFVRVRGGRGMGVITLGTEFQFLQYEKCWRWMVVMAVHLCD